MDYGYPSHGHGHGHGHGQAAYGAPAPPQPQQAYRPPQQGGYPYHAPNPIAPVSAPAPAPAHDPFRADYVNRLRQLTFNSRPIIQDLSLIAMDQRNKGNWERMRAVVEEIEAALLRAPPNAKLPLLYLIDSISKNIGAPYTTHLLPPIIPRMYQKTYREVDGVTRSRMEEMIKLWRNSGPDGSDLYGPEIRAIIERELIGASAGPSQQDVLRSLHSTLASKQRDATVRPWDQAVRHQIGVLQQIASLLSSTQVSPPELQRIMEQLQSMNPPAPSQPPTPTFPPFPPAPRAASSSMSPIAPTLPAVPSPIPHPSQSNGGTTPIPAPTAIPASIPTNVADILRNLGGVLGQPRTPDPNAAPAAVAPPLKAKSGLEAYEDMILSLDVRLESLDLNVMNALPTAHLPQRCKQCGVRFPEADGKMQAHMDWHFRRNRNEREGQGRGAHRRWLPTAEEWIADAIGVNAEAGPSTSAPTTGPAATAAASMLTAEKMAAYARRWVRVPSDPAKAALPCPICKETFKAEWSEEEEEWIWKNAIDVNGTIYHATCRAEQMAARMAAKMLNPDRRSNSKSPRITPGLEDLALSAKRKAGENGGDLKRVKVEESESKPAAAAPAAAAPAVDAEAAPEPAPEAAAESTVVVKSEPVEPAIPAVPAETETVVENKVPEPSGIPGFAPQP